MNMTKKKNKKKIVTSITRHPLNIEYKIDDQDIIDMLEGLRYIGKLYPVSRKDKRPPIIALLVAFFDALKEVHTRFAPILIPIMSEDSASKSLRENMTLAMQAPLSLSG